MNWLKDTLSDGDGRMSSKRLMSFILVILFAVYFFVNLFTGKFLKTSLEDNLFYLLIIMYVGVTAEGWIPKKKDKPEEPKP